MKSLKQIRLDCDKSPAQAAVAAKRSSAAIHNWESGFAHNMSFGNAISLAELYGMSIEEFALIIFPENE